MEYLSVFSPNAGNTPNMDSLHAVQENAQIIDDLLTLEYQLQIMLTLN